MFRLTRLVRLLFLRREKLFLSDLLRNCIWVWIPTSNSSILWLIPWVIKINEKSYKKNLFQFSGELTWRGLYVFYVVDSCKLFPQSCFNFSVSHHICLVSNQNNWISLQHHYPFLNMAWFENVNKYIHPFKSTLTTFQWYFELVNRNWNHQQPSPRPLHLGCVSRAKHQSDLRW